MNLKDWISLHIPTPKYMSLSHVGIDISPTSIHYVEIKRRGSHIELGKYGATQLESPINFTEPLTTDPNLTNALKKMQKQNHMQFVEVSIPEDQAYIFTADIPVGDEQSIRNYIELHLEENVPISLADAVYDYHVIAKPFEQNSIEANFGDNVGIPSAQKTSEVGVNDSLVNVNKEQQIRMAEQAMSITNPNSNNNQIDDTVAQNSSVLVIKTEASQNQTQNQTQQNSPSTNENEKVESNTPVSLPGLDIKAGGPTFFASISVVPKSLIDQYIMVFESAGMTPVSFLVENQAVSKAVIKKGDMSTKLIVHVGNNKTVLSVVSKGSVHFTSTINIGSEDFTKAIMKEFNVSREEAIRMKTEKGFMKQVGGEKAGDSLNDKNQSSIFMSLINTASALKDEIDRIVLYWQSYVSKHSSANDASIDSILLSGRDSLINGFKEYLRATVRLPVDTANVWANVYDLDVHIPHIDYIDSLDYAVAIGLGLPRIGGASH